MSNENNKQYWENRIDNAMKLSEKEILKPLRKIYKKAYANIKDELMNSWLDMVNDGDVSQSALFQKNRMGNLQALIAKELHNVGEKSIELMQVSLFSVAKNAYDSIDDYVGVVSGSGAVKSTFSFLDEQVARGIINQNYKSADFSERIWKDMNKLRIQIEDSVTKSALLGVDVRKVSKQLQEKMNVSYSSSKRIVVTETGRVFNESCRQKAIDRGYTSYSILIEADACEDCINDFEGKHFNINESVLPRHPHCKCCMIVDID